MQSAGDARGARRGEPFLEPLELSTHRSGRRRSLRRALRADNGVCPLLGAAHLDAAQFDAAQLGAAVVVVLKSCGVRVAPAGGYV